MAAWNYWYTILNWIIIAITFLLVLNRLFVHVFGPWGFAHSFNRKAWRLSDGLVLIAWVATLDRAAESTVLDVFGSTDGWTDAQATIAFKMQYVDMALYWWPMYCVKGALLLLYCDFAPLHQWWTLRATGLLCLISFVVTQAIYFFGCQPISSRWSMDPHALDGCISERFVAYYAVIECLHILTDILVFLIPFRLLKYVESREQRISACFMFGLGFVSILSSLLMAVNNMVNGKADLKHVENGNKAAELNEFGVIIEQTTAVCLACVPALRKSACELRDRICAWRNQDCRHQEIFEVTGARKRIDDVETGIRADSTLSDRSTLAETHATEQVVTSSEGSRQSTSPSEAATIKTITAERES